MARRDESWLKNYEDVEFDVPGLGEVGTGSPMEQQPMLPPKTHLKDMGSNSGEMGSLPREGQPHIAGVKASGSLAVQIPPHPTLAPPGTTNPVARIPRSHSAPKVFSNSPLNPSTTPAPTTTTTTTTTTTAMPFPSPFAHTRPPSRGSAYFSRIASEEARAFGTTVPPSSTANHGLTSRGSMILYRVADPFSPPTSLPSANNSGANTPTSHYSLKGLVATDDASLPLPDPSSRNARISMYSTSGDSIVSLSSDSKYPNFESQRSGLIAYVYDPDTDEPLDDDDEVDWLHDPEALIAEKLVRQRNRPLPLRPAYLKAPTESSLSWRGLLNITVLILIISTVLALFIAYPTVATLQSEQKNKLIAFNTRINSTGQAVDLGADPILGGGGTTTTSLTTQSTESTTSTTAVTPTRSTTTSTSTTLFTSTSSTSTSTTSTSTTSTTSASTSTSDVFDAATPSTTPIEPVQRRRRADSLDAAAEKQTEERVENDPWPRRNSRDFGAR